MELCFITLGNYATRFVRFRQTIVARRALSHERPFESVIRSPRFPETERKKARQEEAAVPRMTVNNDGSSRKS